MGEHRPAPPPRLTDSPWYWLALFSITGILLVWITGPRALARRKTLMARYYDRQARGQSVPNPDVAAGQPLAPEEAMGGRWVFVPIQLILAGLLVYATMKLIRQRRVIRGELEESER